MEDKRERYLLMISRLSLMFKDLLKDDIKSNYHELSTSDLKIIYKEIYKIAKSFAYEEHLKREYLVKILAFELIMSNKGHSNFNGFLNKTISNNPTSIQIQMIYLKYSDLLPSFDITETELENYIESAKLLRGFW